MEETVKPKAITLTIVLVIVLAELLDPAGRPSSGQQQIPGNRKPACTCFCGGASPLPFNLFSAEEIDAAKCFGGPLPADKCGDYFKSLPEEQQKSSCATLKKERTSTASCPVLKTLVQYCDEKYPPDKKPDKKCEKPTPWFDSSSNCKDVQSPKIEVNEYYRLFTLSFCGDPVFRYIVPADHPGGIGAYKVQLEYFVRKRVGSRICCDKWREAVRTGTPCNPAEDVDCDGKSNLEDFYTPKVQPVTLPDINNLFTSPEGAPIDPFPAGLNPDDPNLLPPAEKCDCKWELVKGTLTCSPDGKQSHVYQATWRCPSTGNERFTRKEAPATAPCK